MPYPYIAKNMEPIAQRQVLEIGCGSGGNLLQLIQLGFSPENLVGNELLEERASEAQNRLPSAVKILLGDASNLDLPDASFDFVYQSTVFSSILNSDLQDKLAKHMWRMVKRGGGILWYDFIYDNPKNPDVKGVNIKRIQDLFPEGRIKYWRVTLAPPLGRLVTKFHPFMYTMFNLFPFMRTHILCWIQK